MRSIRATCTTSHDHSADETGDTIKTKPNIIASLSALMAIATLTSASTQSAEMPTDPIGGKPPAGSKPSVKDLDY
jgi:hypothetical protein